MSTSDPWALAHDQHDEAGMDAQQPAALPPTRRKSMPDTCITTRPHSEAEQPSTEPLAVLANRYLERKRAFESRPDPADEEVGSFTDAQEDLLEQMEETPAVLLDDLIAKWQVMVEEMWDNAGLNGDDRESDVLEPVDRLLLTLGDDMRRVLGATTAYRFDARLWVESAIRAGMAPWATIFLAPAADGRSFNIKERRLGHAVVVHSAYEPPPVFDKAQMGAVIDELADRGRVDRHYEPLPALDAAE